MSPSHLLCLVFTGGKMTISLALHNHDNHYHSLKFKPILLNDITAKTKEERENLNKLIMTTYNNTDTLESVPSCMCGSLSFDYRLNELCPKCGTRVEAASEKAIESTVWFRAPDGIAGLMNPMVWIMLSKVLVVSHYNVLQWLCNPYFPPPAENNRAAKTAIRRFERLGLPRGLNSFIQNFDQLSPKILDTSKKQYRASLQSFIEMYRNDLFPQYLPIPSKVAFVLENTSTGTYADIPAMREVIDACLTITSLDAETKTNIRRLEGKISSVIAGLSKYYLYMFGKPFGAKKGWWRKTVFGTRMHFAYRAVITSNAGVHDYDTIKLPYEVAATLFRVHLKGKLHREYGMTEPEAHNFCMRTVNNRNPLIEKLLYEILATAGGGRGWPTLLIRYPNLTRAGCQRFFINGISDHSIIFSVLTVRGNNADGGHYYHLQIVIACLVYIIIAVHSVRLLFDKLYTVVNLSSYYLAMGR